MAGDVLLEDIGRDTLARRVESADHHSVTRERLRQLIHLQHIRLLHGEMCMRRHFFRMAYERGHRVPALKRLCQNAAAHVARCADQCNLHGDPFECSRVR